MMQKENSRQTLVVYAMILALLGLGGFLIKTVEMASAQQVGGWMNFSLGFVLLAAYVLSRMVRCFGLPLLTGYIVAGVLAGPFVTGFLTTDTVERLRLIDELALSFIALAAGAELKLAAIRRRRGALALNISLTTLLVMALVGVFIYLAGGWFDVTASFSRFQLIAFAALLAVISVARSPSSTIALINECRAAGSFTETVLGVTMITDILIIVLFTMTMAVSKHLVTGDAGGEWFLVVGLIAEITVSLAVGILLGRGIAVYIQNVGYDFLLFLVFMAFAVTRVSMLFNQLMDRYFALSLHLEPLLICMSAGFFVRNFSPHGAYFTESLDRTALPVYILFFSLAGAALNFDSLWLCWPLALCLVGIRAVGLFCGSWTAGRLIGDPERHNRCAWMTYLTQAGVAIGLSQLVVREFPEIGLYVNTVVLAVIAINQLLGPILFKVALDCVGESGASGTCRPF